MAAQPLT